MRRTHVAWIPFQKRVVDPVVIKTASQHGIFQAVFREAFLPYPFDGIGQFDLCLARVNFAQEEVSTAHAVDEFTMSLL
jgi:hypothetical protein